MAFTLATKEMPEDDVGREPRECQMIGKRSGSCRNTRRDTVSERPTGELTSLGNCCLDRPDSNRVSHAAQTARETAMFPKVNARGGPKWPSNNAADGGRRPNRGKPDGIVAGPACGSRARQETDGTSGSRHVVENNRSTPQELRIMNTFTSDEWSARPGLGPTAGTRSENEAKPAKRVSDGTVVGSSVARTGSSERRPVDRGERAPSSPRPFPRAERDGNESRARVRSDDKATTGRRYSGGRAEGRETVPERRDSSASRLSSSAGGRVTEEFVRHFDPDDFDNNIDSETDGSSSSSSSSSSTVMVRTIRRRNESSSRECRRSTEKPADDDGPAALEAAYRRLIFDKAKESLAKHLIEGLYEVSKRYRHDPFGCLGRWLLIRADIRDEDRIEHEPTEIRLQTPR